MSVAIAIDGHSGSGKGTLARALSAHYNFPCLHTGLLYRALARAVIEAGGKNDDILLVQELVKTTDFTHLDERQLHQGDISSVASEIAQYPEVRAQLLAYQRDFVSNAKQGGVILEGRDIGTVIMPDAPVKFFITAELKIRAQRRFEQLGGGKSLAQIEAEIEARDQRDSARDTAPLKKAPNAHLLDSTNRSIVEMMNYAIQIIDTVKG
jgi:cytidylate kinase